MGKPEEIAFRIYKGGKPESEAAYPSLGQAAAKWAESPAGREVVREDAKGNPKYRYTEAESRKAAERFLHPSL